MTRPHDLSTAPRRFRRSSGVRRLAFTLLELLVACAVFLLLMTMLMNILMFTSDIWQRSEGQKVRQQSARRVLEIMSRDLESAIFPLDLTNTKSFQLVVNPGFSEYQNPDAAFWHASSPGDTSTGDVIEVGYFIAWSQSEDGVTSELRRLQLMTDEAGVFENPETWLSQQVLETEAPGSSHDSLKGRLADNVIALWITLFDRDGNELALPYDSRNQLADPASRAVSAEISLVVADANLMKRLTSKDEITSHYTAADVDTFVEQLPEKLRSGVQIFQTRINFGVSL